MADDNFKRVITSDDHIHIYDANSKKFNPRGNFFNFNPDVISDVKEGRTFNTTYYKNKENLPSEPIPILDIIPRIYNDLVKPNVNKVNPNTLSTAGSTLGKVGVGALAGAGTGAGIGSAIPVIGNLTGLLAGALIGGSAGLLQSTPQIIEAFANSSDTSKFDPYSFARLRGAFNTQSSGYSSDEMRNKLMMLGSQLPPNMRNKFINYFKQNNYL